MKVNIEQAKEMVTETLKAGLVPNLSSSPGIGKSDIIREVAKEFNLKLIDFRLAQSDPTDLNGFPTLNEKRTRSHYAPPVTIPLEGDIIPKKYSGWLLFFDEMNASPLSMQAASYKVILDKAIGEFNIHKKVAMVCAGNLSTDKAIVNRLSTAMQSRLIHIDLEVDSEAWLKWAIKEKIDHKIISFIRFRPELLHKFDPNHSDNTFPCPRTWEFLSKLVKKWNTITIKQLPLMIGTVGEGAATEFFGYVEVYSRLPSLDAMIKHPEVIIIPDEPSTLYAISSLIGLKTNEGNIDKLMIIINKLPIEFQVITLQSIIRVDNSMQRNTNIKLWLSANANELIED